jgi:hypothetical protein
MDHEPAVEYLFQFSSIPCVIEMGMGEDDGGQGLSRKHFGDPVADQASFKPDARINRKGILFVTDQEHIASA